MIDKTCKTCRNNVEFPPPHTCDVCNSLDAEDEYEMWQPKKTCRTCEYDDYSSEMYEESGGYPEICINCWDEKTDIDFINWTPKGENSLNGEFYLRLVCNIDGKEVEISRIKLTDLVNKMTTDVVDSFCKAIKMK